MLTVVAQGAATAEPPKEQSRRRLVGRLLRHPPVAAVTALIALAASCTSLLYTFWPDLRPDPQVQLNGSIKVATWESHVTYGDYLQRTHQYTALRRADTNRRKTWGNLYYVQVESAGLKRRASELRTFVYYSRSKQRFGDAQAYGVIKYGTPSDRFLTPVWVQPPADRGTYFVRFELRARGVLLAIADSPPFAYCHEKDCGA